jgi:hypothetical protein
LFDFLQDEASAHPDALADPLGCEFRRLLKLARGEKATTSFFPLARRFII